MFPTTAEDRFQIRHPLIAETNIYGIHDGDLLIHDDIGIVCHSERHNVLSLEQVYVMVIYTYILDIIRDLHTQLLYRSFLYRYRSFLLVTTSLKSYHTPVQESINFASYPRNSGAFSASAGLQAAVFLPVDTVVTALPLAVDTYISAHHLHSKGPLAVPRLHKLRSFRRAVVTDLTVAGLELHPAA